MDEKKCLQGTDGETPNKTGRLKEPGADGRIILKWMLQK
jgi:hypothetical protein